MFKIDCKTKKLIHTNLVKFSNLFKAVNIWSISWYDSVKRRDKDGITYNLKTLEISN